ncbi:MAG: undecaprenyl-diphosphatase [Acetobacteraceae bacterium]
MLHWNMDLFLALNAPANPGVALVQFATILARTPFIVGPAILIVLWVWGPPSHRGALLAVVGATAAGLGINVLIGLVWFEPRPFMIGVGHTLLRHAADNSFPSDHATFVWSLGAGLIATRAAPRWGAAVCLYGVGVAWSRVFLGVHFPDDMAASALVALVSGGIARWAAPLPARWLLPYADDLYEATLRGLHLPPALIPRQASTRR